MAIMDIKAIEAKSDQMNAVDLVSDMTFKIVRADYKPNDKQTMHLHLEGHEGRPYKPSKGMMRGLWKAWGNDSDNWQDRMITLFCNPTVKWAGKEAGGIQISAISGIDKPLKFNLKLSRSQTVVHTFNVIEYGNAPKQFIFTHWEHNINEAKTVDEIGVILSQAKKEFPDKFEVLIPVATKAKEELS